MSDYDYEQEYQYDEQPQAEEEDISTKVQLDYFQIQDLIRGGKMDKAIDQLEKLYVVCQQNNLKNYKIKILNQLLTIYSKNGKVHQIASTLARISQLNKQEKYTENAVKAIITIVRGSHYSQIKKELIAFIQHFDDQIKLRSYLFLLERAIEECDKEESSSIYTAVQQLVDELDTITASTQLEYYSLEIKYSKMMGVNIKEKMQKMELMIPKLETQAYMSEGHIAVLKLALGEIMFDSGNYENSASNIFQAFLEKSKYGSSGQLKEILKANALICMLIENPLLSKNDKMNSLYHDSSIPFKNQPDIQHLISLIDSFERHDIEEFIRLYKLVNFKPQNPNYLSVYEKLLFKMKKEKLIKIVKSYQTITFQYIGRRLDLNEKQVERIVFELIVDQKLRGRINDCDPTRKHLEILKPANQFLEIQAANLRELGRRYLS